MSEVIFIAYYTLISQLGMDFNHEEEAIAGLELDRVKIKAVAELCSSTQSELNVAKLIERYFAKEEHPANKTALFLLAS